MGIYINLDIKPNKISSELWKDTFDEVFSFINKTPLGFRTTCEIDNKTFLIYKKPQLLQDSKGNEYISLSADLERMTHCESFELYNDINAYICDATSLEDEISIWRSKTQRFAYHKYILAIGLLIEYRLQGLAFVSGDITTEEIEESREILKTILNLDVYAPARFESDTSVNQMFGLMALFGASVGDLIVSPEDCLDFGKHLINSLDGNRGELHKFSNDDLRTIIFNASSKYGFTWTNDILNCILETSNRDILLGYAATVTVDCNNRDIFEYVCRFYKDNSVHTQYVDLLTKQHPHSNSNS